MRRFALCWLAAAGLLGLAAATRGQGPADTEVIRAGEAEGDIAARRLLKRAQELLLAGEKDRGVKMLENVVEQHPDSFVRYYAYLELGKHFLEQYQQPQAISYLRRMKELERGDEELKGETADLYLEATYLTGVAYFQLRQYANAFPILRKITTHYPNTVWANQAYYYVGMCHFAQGNWKQAIRDLSLVGTFVDPRSPAQEYVEAGRRFYVKVEDGDLPVLQRLGRDVKVDLATGKGDTEALVCIPLSGKKGLFIASVATEIAAPRPNNGTLEVVGGDTVAVKYYDDNTKEGRKDVPRQKQVRVVSTGSVNFTTGTYESAAAAAFQKQPLFVLLQDADLDGSDAADTAQVRIVSRYKEETASGELGLDLERPEAGEEAAYKIRDEVALTLKELGQAAPVHSGRFGGSVDIDAYREAQPVDKTDAALVCAVGDEVVATYIDNLHIGGESPREAKATTKVGGEIDRTPQPQQNVVPDPVLLARKNLVEATALLELARIFKSMGLMDGAKEKANEGLDRIAPVLQIDSPIPSNLKEEAFRLKWNLYIVQEDYKNAIVTCQLFNRLYPDSPFVDQALLGIGHIRFENKDYDQARGVFEQILRLERSLAKAEAQYMIAQAIEAKALAAATAAGTPRSQFIIPETAIQQYKLCADRYPDSPFAGESLAKLVQYYIDSRDYAQASDLLERVFEEYPDAEFLDTMLLQWVLVAYNMGDLPKAYEKCSQLVTEYPNSKHAPRAHELLDRIKKALERTAEPAEPAAASADR
jgi:TolA-binding protein